MPFSQKNSTASNHTIAMASLRKTSTAPRHVIPSGSLSNKTIVSAKQSMESTSQVKHMIPSGILSNKTAISSKQSMPSNTKIKHTIPSGPLSNKRATPAQQSIANTAQIKNGNEFASPLNGGSTQASGDLDLEDLLSEFAFSDTNDEDTICELRAGKPSSHYQQHDDFETTISSYSWKMERVYRAKDSNRTLHTVNIISSDKVKQSALTNSFTHSKTLATSRNLRSSNSTQKVALCNPVRKHGL
jgi:hypothetical protein